MRLSSRGFRGGIAGLAILLCMAACDPVLGTGPGNPPDLNTLIHVDAADRSVVITLIAGYPAGEYQFNYDGYGGGGLVVTVPVGWTATIQCENRGTVANSCSVVADQSATAPLRPDWTTVAPTQGLDPGASGSFDFAPSKTGSYRIASLVDGHEASGMWADLEVTPTGKPTLTAPGG